MAQIDINKIKNGMTIIIDGKLCLIEEFQHVKPGKGSAFMVMKLRNLRTGSLVEETYNTNIKIEQARVERIPMQFQYMSGDDYVFANTETWETMEVTKTQLGNVVNYIKDGSEVTIQMYEGEILGVAVPDKLEFVITETTEATKGNTTNNAQKDATLETGYVVKVPLFIAQGEKIIISTADGKYAGRAK